MFNTSNINLNKISPIIEPGNHVIKINSLEYTIPSYDENAIIITLNVETKPVEGDFIGLLTDVSNPNSPRYKGRVGRVKLNAYPFVNKEFASGQKILRDEQIQKYMVVLAEATGNRGKLDEIEADTAIEFLNKCKVIFQNSNYFNACIGGKEYRNQQNYINIDLHFPKLSTKSFFITSLDKDCLVYDANLHLKKLETNLSSQNTDFEM